MSAENVPGNDQSGTVGAEDLPGSDQSGMVNATDLVEVNAADLDELAELKPAAGWLADARARIAASPTAIATLFPAAGRRCGRAVLSRPAGWTVDDAARALLLLALPPADRATQAAELYRYGDAAERRGVLRALPLLDIGEAGLPLVHDALRTNDTRLVAAALGPYAATHLEPAHWRQAVLKCLFIGVPLAVVAGLDRRADATLARMLADFAHERVAAGRDVPAEVWPLLAGHADVADRLQGELDRERHAAAPGRQQAARRALSALEEYR